MKTMRNVRTHDEAFPLGRRRSKLYTRDLVLSALEPGKQAVSWMTWQGDLAPVIDELISSVGSINGGPGLGEPFSAERGPVTAIMLGQVFDGALRQIREAVAEANTEAVQSDGVNVGELYQAARDLQEMFEAGDPQGTQTSFDALRKTRDAINARRAAQVKATGDALAGRESRRVAAALGQFRDGAARLWGKQQPAIATGDGLGAMRDALAASRKATDSRGQIEALNQANSQFWKGRTADMKSPTPAQGTGNGQIAAINEANAAFWAARR